ncbi:hypothetical protein DFH09DRAFT_1178308 [Mycena vulgaris]|nr:hypothetical protein DFH09DRAFT_1178308 [Mycena vulgaris]
MNSVQVDTPPVIPLEIQFLILDHINVSGRSARVMLHRLSFICAAWAAHIQSSLFRHVTFDPVTRDRFLALLHESNHLAQYVNSLTPMSCVASDTPDLISQLPNLRTLHVRGHIFGPLPTPAATWPTVTRLRIMFCVLSCAQDLWALLGLFPRCESLEFGGWMYPDSAADIGDVVAAPALHVKHLVLEASPTHSLNNVAAQLAKNALTVDRFSVVLAGLDDDDASAINVLLSRLGASLQELKITEASDGLAPVVGICLAPCTALRRLIVSLRFSALSAPNMRAGLLSLLRHATSPALATLTLKVPRSTGLLDLPWGELDAVLAGDAFENLHKVVFELERGQRDLTFDEVADGIADVMVHLRARGLLRFTRWDRQ